MKRSIEGNKTKKKTAITLFSLTIFLMLPSIVYAETGSVDISKFPNRLSEMLTISLFSARLLASAILTSFFVFPTMLLTGRKNQFMPTLVILFMCLCVCIGLGWLDYWILLLIAFAVAGLWATRFKDMVT